MNNRIFSLVLLALLTILPVTALRGAESVWKAGVAKAAITPTEPIWLAGYAARTKPSEGKLTELWVKVLALEDAAGHRALILTSDTLGMSQSLYTNLCARLNARFGLKPEQVILSASHTHSGPVLRDALYDIYPLDDQQRAVILKYSTWLEEVILETCGKALADLAPVSLASGQGVCGFAVNRRSNPEGGVPKLISEGALKGPVDHAVPVLAVSLPDGQLKALLFGYACHNTVLDINLISGDYAGFAQIALEKSHPGTMAMFFIGCGSDQNPVPRRQIYLAERYGTMLAGAVEEVLRRPLQNLEPELKTSLELVSLNLGPALTDAELEKFTKDKVDFYRRWATRILAESKAGKTFPRTYPFPLQAWRLGNQLLLTIGGEPVVDYALKFKEEFGTQTWVAGYCNDVMTYIPSLRVLKEGGYEGSSSMMVYGLPVLKWADDVEDLVTASARRQVQQIKR